MKGLVFKIRRGPAALPRAAQDQLDELPQLWKVLRGNMSLVGPRPPMPTRSGVARYTLRQAQRLSVMPGSPGCGRPVAAVRFSKPSPSWTRVLRDTCMRNPEHAIEPSAFMLVRLLKENIATMECVPLTPVAVTR